MIVNMHGKTTIKKNKDKLSADRLRARVGYFSRFGRVQTGDRGRNNLSFRENKGLLLVG
jgi:hypothetical protein